MNKFKEYIKKIIYKIWFQTLPLLAPITGNSYKLSGWGINQYEYDDVINHCISKMNPKISKDSSLFELGCGTGKSLEHISNQIKLSKVGGSDIFKNPLDLAKKIYPQFKHLFNVQKMQDKHKHINNNSFDHVVSFGALAMYLTKEEIKLAMIEAVRITRPGGSLCITHFIEPNGKGRGSILEPIYKSELLEMLNSINVENIKIFKLKHQDYRYFVVFNKKRNKFRINYTEQTL